MKNVPAGIIGKEINICYYVNILIAYHLPEYYKMLRVGRYIQNAIEKKKAIQKKLRA